jgi:protein involved in polysaccharide export with SLBB domain
MAKRPESEYSRLHPFDPRRFLKAEGQLVRSGYVEHPAIGGLFSLKSGRTVPLWFVVLGLCLSFTGSGCATVKGETYTYKTLPQSLVAGVRENPQTVDLTQLASASSKTDVIDKGDVVEVTIAAGLNEKDTVRMPVRIQDTGFADLPEIGRIQLAGLEMEAAEAAIVYECISRGLYRSPNVTLLMKRQRTNRIMVAGAVKKPSVYELPRGQCDLLAALSRAEGLDPTAGTQVIIRNPRGSSRSRPDSVADAAATGVAPIGHSVEQISSMNDTIKVDLVSATKNGTGNRCMSSAW